MNETPKGKGRGRPKKSGFKGRKLDFTHVPDLVIQPSDHVSNITVSCKDNSVNQLISPTSTTLAENVPVRLINGENVCFFNSTVQIFYSLIPYQS